MIPEIIIPTPTPLDPHLVHTSLITEIDKTLISIHKTKKTDSESSDSSFYSSCEGFTKPYDSFEKIPNYEFDLSRFSSSHHEKSNVEDSFNGYKITNKYHPADIYNINPYLHDAATINKIMLLHDEHISQVRSFHLRGLATWQPKLISTRIQMYPRCSFHYQSNHLTKLYNLYNLIGTKNYTSATEITLKSRTTSINDTPVSYINQYQKTNILASKIKSIISDSIKSHNTALHSAIESITIDDIDVTSTNSAIFHVSKESNDIFGYLEPDSLGYLVIHIFIFNKSIEEAVSRISSLWETKWRQLPENLKITHFSTPLTVKLRLCAIRHRLITLCIDDTEFELLGNKVARYTPVDPDNDCPSKSKIVIPITIRLFNSLLWFFSKRNTPFKGIHSLFFSKSISSDIHIPIKPKILIKWFKKYMCINDFTLDMSDSLPELSEEDKSIVDALLARELEQKKHLLKASSSISNNTSKTSLTIFKNWMTNKLRHKDITIGLALKEIAAVNNHLVSYYITLSGQHVSTLEIQKSRNESISFNSISNFKLAPEYLIDGLVSLYARMVSHELPQTHMPLIDDLISGLNARNNLIKSIHRHQIKHLVNNETIPLIPYLQEFEYDECLQILAPLTILVHKITPDTPSWNIKAEMTRLSSFLQKPICSKVISPLERCEKYISAYLAETLHVIAIAPTTAASMEYEYHFGRQPVQLD